MFMRSGFAARLANGSIYGLGEDVPDARRMLTQHVRVDPQRDGRIGVAEAGSYHMDGYSGEKQCGGVRPGVEISTDQTLLNAEAGSWQIKERRCAALGHAAGNWAQVSQVTGTWLADFPSL
jgi:hypothetical protein